MAETPNPPNGSVEPRGSASGDASVKTAADAPNPEYRGERDESIRAHARFLWLTMLASAAVIEYGLDHAMGAFQAMVGFLKVFGYEDPRVPAGWNIAAGPQQIIASFMVLGAFIACFTTGPMSTYFSRRWSILIGVVLLVIAVTIMIVTTSMGALYFSRLLLGYGNGLVMTFTMVYVSEMAPASQRGLSYGITSGWITTGMAIAMLIANATEGIESRLCYQIPLYVLYAMPVVSFASLPFMPESPRWLLLNGRDEEALKALTWIRNGAYDELALRAEFEEMRLNALRDLENESKWLVLDLFRGTNLRRTLLSVGVGLINPSTGAMFVLSYNTYFFKVLRVANPFKWSVLFQWIGVAGMFCAWYALTKLGRRPLLLMGIIGCGSSMLFLGVVYSLPVSADGSAISAGVIFLLCWFNFWFNVGLAPTTYLVAGELPSQSLRAYTAGLSTGAGFVFAWLTNFTAPYFINPAELNWGGRYGYIWAGSTVVVAAFVYLCLPEVKGRSLEEIEEMFDLRLPAKEFSSYVSQNAVIARQAAEKDLYGGEKPGAVHVEASTRV